MPLVSDLFTKPRNQKLEDCLIDNAKHIPPGSFGDHVKLIQIALNQLSSVFLKIDGLYGFKTAAAVVKFKEAQTPPLRQPGQIIADNIVGMRTIESLDNGMFKLEKKPDVAPGSLLVSVTEAGSPHDHSLCPRLEAGNHLGTPINPVGFGRKINIFGDHETDYLGFEDFSSDPKFLGGRPLTFDKTPAQGGRGLDDNTASDICIRSSPITDSNDTNSSFNTLDEIKRIAMPGCRLTHSGPEENIATFGRKTLSLGILMDKIVIRQKRENLADSIFIALVILILK